VVLVVDDEPAMRLLHTINLEAAGIVVLSAADGPAAVSLARSEQPDLAIVDVSLPGMDGFKVAEELRRDPRTSEIRVLFVSGATGVANEARAAALGAVGYVNKPFDPDDLLGLVLGTLAVEPEHVARRLNACAA
jgi:CheY-like chemotaxis protein